MITQEIPLTSLLLDTNNPRLEIQRNQNEALLTMAAVQSEKLVQLAKDIVEFGINLTDLPIVMPTSDDKPRFVVLEGNRRVAALKILSTPDILGTMVKPVIKNRFKKLSEKFLKDPVDHLFCVVVKDRDEADHWITLKHAGQNSGAGLVGWGAVEKGRYAERKGTVSPELQILDFVRQYGKLNADALSRLGEIKLTNLQRLISDPAVRAKLGISISDKQVVTNHSHEEVVKGLVKVVLDVARKEFKVDTIYTKEKRAEYLNSFSKKELPSTQLQTGAMHKLGELPTQNPSTTIQPVPKRRSNPKSGLRTTLIPRTCILEISEIRINNVYIELKQLNIDNYPNAGAVLFRVFLELSLDAFIDANNLSLNQNAKLRDKLTATATYFKSNNKMTDAELQPVRRAATGQTLLASDIPTLHGYVHNRHFNPAPGDLKTAWDDLQKFAQMIWS